MAETITDVGDKSVRVYEVGDDVSAEVVDESTATAIEFYQQLEQNPVVTKVSRDVSQVSFCYDVSDVEDKYGTSIDFPRGAEILTFEQNIGFDTGNDGGIFVHVQL